MRTQEQLAEILNKFLQENKIGIGCVPSFKYRDDNTFSVITQIVLKDITEEIKE